MVVRAVVPGEWDIPPSWTGRSLRRRKARGAEPASGFRVRASAMSRREFARLAPEVDAVPRIAGFTVDVRTRLMTSGAGLSSCPRIETISDFTNA